MSRILNTPIMTSDDAKAYYMGMGCSHFHMQRQSEQRYQEYRRLAISKETEDEWKREAFDMLANAVLQEKDVKQIWYQHSIMIDIAQMLKDIKTYLRLLEVTQAMLMRLPKADYPIVAANLMGRTDVSLHQGFIYDCNGIDHRLCVCFLKITQYLLDDAEPAIEGDELHQRLYEIATFTGTELEGVTEKKEALYCVEPTE